MYIPLISLPSLGRFCVCKLEQMNIDPDKEIQYLKKGNWECEMKRDSDRRKESDVYEINNSSILNFIFVVRLFYLFFLQKK